MTSAINDLASLVYVASLAVTFCLGFIAGLQR